MQSGCFWPEAAGEAVKFWLAAADSQRTTT